MSMEDKAWLDYRARFADTYDEYNYFHSLQSMVMCAGHRLTEKKFLPSDHFRKVLEIGAGTGMHISFVKHRFDQYVCTDLDSEVLAVANKKLGGQYGDSLRFETQSGLKLSYEDNSFDRLIATHVLEHISQPHLALKEWSRVVREGGVVSILIPTDPGLAWRFSRHLGPRRRAVAQGIDYDYVMAREHVNPCNNLIAFIRHYFPDRTESWWPFGIPSIDGNLFFMCHAVVRTPGT